MRPSRWLVAAAVAGASVWAPAVAAQDRVARQNLDRARDMLRTVRRDIERHYYDSTYQGVDLEGRFRHADSVLGTVATLPEMFAVISQFVADLHDSHTRFYPPSQVARVRYGFQWQLIGDSAYITRVQPQSDAQAKGLAPGDRILGIDGMQVTRETDDVIRYVYYGLRPRPGLRIAVEKPDRSRVQLDVMSQVTRGIAINDWTSMQDRGRLIREIEQGSSAGPHRWYAFGDSVLVWRMRGFWGGDEGGVDDMIRRARRFRALVLDLRNNSGGAVNTMLRVVASFFDHDVTVGVTRERAKLDTMVARARRAPYRGELIVLVNSGSASASEITARIFQLQRRATIVGDRSAGATMVSQIFPHEAGFERVFEYAIQVSAMDHVMPDSARLEGRGVIPDVPVLPGPTDLANRLDPAMSVALNLVGVSISAAEAARLFPEERDR